MKLIIDIPDTYYEYCKAQEDAIEIQLAVKNGTPLDKIRKEIIQVANQEKVHDEKWALGLRYAVNIIDKYRESEEIE